MLTPKNYSIKILDLNWRTSQVDKGLVSTSIFNKSIISWKIHD